MNSLLLAAEVNNIDVPPVEWAAISPFLIMAGGAIVLMVAGSLLRGATAKKLYAPAAALIAVAAGIAAIPQWHKVQDEGAFVTIAGAIGIDGFSLFSIFVIAAGAALACLFLDGYLARENLVGVEPYVLVLLSSTGGMVMGSANDLIVVFLGLEILSISAYVLAGIHVRRLRSGEAALKYFIMGSFASAVFLYGIALVYGATGSTHIADVADFLAANTLSNDLLLMGGIFLIMVGFAFKVAAVPFHTWAPDVYQGSPTPVSGFMASAVKVGGFVGFLRVFFLAFDLHRLDWQPVIYVLAILTMIVGAVLSVVQTDVKRLLAYSSINHAGFLLMALQTGTDQGASAALFYLACYTFMVAGSFGVVGVLGRKGDGHHSLTDYRGAALREPVLAFGLTVFLLAQAGVPFTAGFIAKFQALAASIDAGSWPLALVGMVSTVITAFLYLKIIISMYGSEEDAAEVASVPRMKVPWGTWLGLTVSFVFVIGVGIIPGPITNIAEHAIPHIIAVAP